MADDAPFLRAQAKKCRWLAQRINGKDVVESLLEMAREYEARAQKTDPGGVPPGP
jgi:hypothetical protein